ncbi:heavy-metal-associated domain-containing protein [Pseudomonas sp. BMS12]|jgi:copper chaperone|uniref:heavy-metal-associated domain-containing protein n=1 Tax=Pseudomonas sp. BMS12 TaxID=1796033 RepID=UPI0009ECFB9A|nr:heavy metal-associated domain-containing protein [Pseudomonas sp. BMS12]
MVVLKVTGMGCGSCVSKITRAIQALDSEARVVINRATGTVSVSTEESAAAVRETVLELGFGAEIDE